MPEFDLLGDEIKPEVEEPPKKRKETQPNGYAATPGSGPNSMRCRDCAHYVIKSTPAGYTKPKCALMKHAWTNGRGSDIKVSSPACWRFEER
jgi:hypothetical protein